METFECVAVYTVRFPLRWTVYSKVPYSHIQSFQLHLQVTELRISETPWTGWIRIQKVKPVTETLNRLDPVNGNVWMSTPLDFLHAERCTVKRFTATFKVSLTLRIPVRSPICRVTDSESWTRHSRHVRAVRVQWIETFECVAVYTVRFPLRWTVHSKVLYSHIQSFQLHLQVTELRISETPWTGYGFRELNPTQSTPSS